MSDGDDIFVQGFLGSHVDEEAGLEAYDSGLGGWNYLGHPLHGPATDVSKRDLAVRHAREFFERIYPIKKSWDDHDYFEDPPSGHLVIWTKTTARPTGLHGESVGRARSGGGSTSAIRLNGLEIFR
jgi:hypothetical protein